MFKIDYLPNDCCFKYHVKTKCDDYLGFLNWIDDNIGDVMYEWVFRYNGDIYTFKFKKEEYAKKFINDFLLKR